MDYSKIKLANERNSHVTKRLNRLSTWKFFKVIYRENIWRMFGYNFLMILCLAPLFVMSILGSMNLSSAQQGLPMLNSFGFSTGVWEGVDIYLTQQIRQINTFTGAMMVVSSILLTVMMSGGFAVIRDSFWTGKLGAVGVFKSMWKGFKSNIFYAFASVLIIAGSIFGIYELYVYLDQIALITWLAILSVVLLSILLLLVVTFLMILCSVTVTYKQSFKANICDSWRLMWLNFLPNILHLIVALIPVGLYFLFGGSFLQQIFLILMLMFGGLYFPLVWHTHMMRTFALFHPVEVKKKKKVAQETANAANAANADGNKQRPTSAKKRKTLAPAAADEPVEQTDDVTEEPVQDTEEPTAEQLPAEEELAAEEVAETEELPAAEEEQPSEEDQPSEDPTEQK